MSQPELFSVAILAGGYGTRLGEEKAGALVAGRPLLHWIAEAVAGTTDDLIVVRRADQDLPASPSGVFWRAILDRRADAGPLAGIEAALHAAHHDVVVVVACDMPLVHPALLQALAVACGGLDLAIPNLDGKAQPLLAAYRRSCLPTVEAQLDAGEGRIRAIVPLLRHRMVEREEITEHDPALESFHNINYREDVGQIAARLVQRGPAHTNEAQKEER